MKKILLALVSLAFLQIGNAQQTKDPLERLQRMDSTKIPPKGTFIKNGKVNLSSGYKITLSEDGEIGTIRKQNGNEATALVSCSCNGEGSCQLSFAGKIVLCVGDACCIMVVTTVDANQALTSKSGSEDANITWKVLVIPKTKTTTNSY